MTPSSPWYLVHTLLHAQEPGSFVPFRKPAMPHPRDEGAVVSVGLPINHDGEDEIADYRFPPNHLCRGLHIKEYPSYWVAHLDRVNTKCDALEHRHIDSPGSYVAGGAGVGALVGAALGRNWESLLIGAGLGALIAAVLAEENNR